MVVGEDLELRIQVEVQKDEACESSCRVATGKAFERVVDGFPVTRADGAVVVDLSQSIAGLRPVVGYYRLADGKEVRTKATDEPFQEDLENRCSDQ